jgi:hypothetical protein
MEKEIRDALNRLVGATGAVHQAALDLQRAMDRDDLPSAPRPALPPVEPPYRPQSTSNGTQCYDIPAGTKSRRCKSCGATIYFVPTGSGRIMPVESDGLPHWERCNAPEQFRRE